MKRTIKVKFLGITPPLENRFFYQCLLKKYDIVQSERPDYLIAQDGLPEHDKYDDAVKIYLGGENSAPDFNAFDYAIASDHMEFGDRYLRSPLFVRLSTLPLIGERLNGLSDAQLVNRKFCSFVVSNSLYGDPMRKRFFDRLSKYKRVDSGGRYMNNVGGPVNDKLEFCRRYKFNISFENCSHPGYTTEKVMEAFVADTLPIYYGDPLVGDYFNTRAMVRVSDEGDIERAVAEIIALDRDDAAYLERLRTPCMIPGEWERLRGCFEDFLIGIFERPLESAKRRAFYGHQAMMRGYRQKLGKIERAIAKVKKVLPI